MFLPENQKKLTNISIVSLRRASRKYELAVFPNKLYEYRRNPSVPLGTVLQSPVIFKNVGTGELCSQRELQLLYSETCRHDSNSDNSSTKDNSITEDKILEKITRKILDEGHEQKAIETSLYELASVEKQLVDLVHEKVLLRGAHVPKELLERDIRSVWNIRNGEVRRQVGGVIKKLVEIGYDRVSYVVTVMSLDNGNIKRLFDHLASCISDNNSTHSACNDNKYNAADNSISLTVKSDVLPDVLEICEKNGLKFFVYREEEAESEELVC